MGALTPTMFVKSKLKSDPILVTAVIKLKLARNVRKKQSEMIRYNIQKLKDKKIKKEFATELKKKQICSCETLDEGQKNEIEEMWREHIQNYNTATKEIFGEASKKTNKEWITATALQ